MALGTRLVPRRSRLNQNVNFSREYASHDAPWLSLPHPRKKKMHNLMRFLISPGYYSRPKRNWKQCFCKIWGANSCIMGDVQVATTNSRSETVPNDLSFSMLATQSWRTKDFKIPTTSCSSFASFLPYCNKKFRFRLHWKVNGNFYARLLLSFTLLLSGVFKSCCPFRLIYHSD